MKATKEGKLKLSKNERQIGNFIWKNEPEHIKVTDINSLISHRVTKGLNIGIMLEMALKQNDERFLSIYQSILWLFSSIIPDQQWVEDIDKACGDCINRNREFYGFMDDLTEEKDNEILEEVKGMHEFEQKVIAESEALAEEDASEK